VAALKELLEYARETRRQAVELRARNMRLTDATAATRRDHVARRQSCVEAMQRSIEVRSRVPSWPAWTGPTPDLRSTLLPLE
jgi:hypothetical protein